MKHFEIRFRHSKSPLQLTETVTAESYQYAKAALNGRYEGLTIVGWREVKLK